MPTVQQLKSAFQERTQAMPAILRPDLKALVWAGIGFLVIPRVLKMVSR